MRASIISLFTLIAIAVAGCSDGADVAPNDPGEPRGPSRSGVEATIEIATAPELLPVAKRLQTRIGEQRPGVELEVVASDTHTAITRVCLGDATIAAVVRGPTKSENRLCKRNRREPGSVRVAHQAIAIVAHPRLGIRCLSTDQLAALWRAGSPVRTYRDLGDRLPERRVRLHAQGLDRETDDFFSEAVIGREGALRRDTQFRGGAGAVAERVADDRNAIGFSGLTLGPFAAGPDLRLAVDDGEGCVRPTAASVQAGEYRPLSRPLRLVFASETLEREPATRVLRHALRHTEQVADHPGIVPLAAAETRAQLARLATLEGISDEG